MSLPNCPKCNSEYVYEDGILLVCPECAYEWDPNEVAEEEGLVVLDSNGTRLADGDTVTVIKDKSASLSITYKNTFPASDEYLKETKGVVRK